jgi:adenylosuccinate lyase
LAFSSAAQSSSVPIESVPTVSVPLSEQLKGLATMLEQALTDSATDWDSLSAILISLSSRLEKASTQSRDLERENESMLKSLDNLDSLLADSRKINRNKTTELWITRAAAVLALGYAVIKK